MKPGVPVKIPFTNYKDSVRLALDAIGAADILPKDRLILLKPNLTNDSPPPVTTPVALAEAVYLYCSAQTSAPICIGEGCGSGKTSDTFERNGYARLAKRYGIDLIDFNNVAITRLQDPNALQLTEFFLPTIALDAFIISLPVLKDHSFTTTTIAMKNMFGLAPERIYGGSWNKSGLHSPSTHRSVVDVCTYKRPELCVVDAVTALTGMHLAGTPRRLNTVIAGFDPVAVDALGSRMLDHNPRTIEYLQLANGKLGNIDPTS
jgi:uncharacterized protein (DUF362 family)